MSLGVGAFTRYLSKSPSLSSSLRISVPRGQSTEPARPHPGRTVPGPPRASLRVQGASCALGIMRLQKVELFRQPFRDYTRTDCSIVLRSVPHVSFHALPFCSREAVAWRKKNLNDHIRACIHAGKSTEHLGAHDDKGAARFGHPDARRMHFLSTRQRLSTWDEERQRQT